ncbi:MAG TPA: hypothetical protein VGP76_21065 [Planctomycetaceae bacterium]|jgi:hypothetical protein|nr:hypothetical protein [Planctomycetaceae bacterium]
MKAFPSPLGGVFRGPGHGYGLAASARNAPPNPLTQLRPKAAPATAPGIKQVA